MPDKLKLVNVLVVPAVNSTDAGCVVFVMSLNVFDPVIVNVLVLPWLSVQLNVKLAPTNVLEVAPVIEITPVPVPAVVVKFVGCALLNAVAPAPDMTNVPPLNVKFLVPVAVVSLVVHVSVKPAKLSVPLVNVVVPVIPASKSVVVIPVPLIFNVDIDFPVNVNVPLPTIVKLPLV